MANISITQDNDEIEFSSTTMMVTSKTKFTVGVDFEEVQPSGDLMRVIMFHF